MKWFKKKEEPKDWDTRRWFEPHPGEPKFALIRPALLNAASGAYALPSELHPVPKAIAMANGLNFEYTHEFRPELALISMSCVTHDGNIQNVQIRKHYLGNALSSLATSLNLDTGSLLQSLLNGKRAIVVCVVGIDPPKPLYSTPGQALDAFTAEERRKIKGVMWYYYKPTRFVSGATPVDPPKPQDSGFLVADALGPLSTPTEEFFFLYTATTTDSDSEGVIQLEKVVQYCFTHVLSALPEPGRERWCRDFLRPALAHMQAKIKGLETEENP